MKITRIFQLLAGLLTAPAVLAVPQFSAQSYALGNGRYPVRLVGGADLSGDGLSDLVVMTDDGGVCLFTRRADGSFAAGFVAQDAMFPYAVAIADFNRDGRVDIAYAVSGGVQLLLQNAGGFTAGALVAAPGDSQGMLVEGLVAGDFNGDGKADLALADNDELATGNPGSSLFIAYGRGDGSFDTSRARAASVIWPRKLFGLDANLDGRGDLLVGSAGGPIGLDRYDTAGTAFVHAEITASGLDSIADAVSGDLNGDGKPDLALLMDSRTGPYLRLDQGDGAFNFTPHPQRIALPCPASGLRHGDFDNDGKPDLLVALQSGGPAVAALLHGRGDLTVDPPQLIGGGFAAAGLARGDYDNDGKLDFALIDTRGRTLTVYLQQ